MKKYVGNMKEYIEKFRAFQQKGGRILRGCGRGHNSWDGPQYRKGTRLSRQKFQTFIYIDENLSRELLWNYTGAIFLKLGIVVVVYRKLRMCNF